VSGADLVVFETGVTHYRWGGQDLPEARLPVLRTPTVLLDAGRALRNSHHPLVDAGVRSLVAVPVQLDARSSAVGTLWVAARRANAFDASTVARLESFAAILAELDAPPANESAHRAFVEALPLAAVSVHEGRVYPNAAACQLTGFSGGAGAPVEAWFRQLFGDEAGGAQATYDVDRHGGFGDRRVVSVQRPGAGERLVEWAAQRLGEYELWLLYDVTERAASEERFRVLFEQSSTALVVYDETGIIDCNPATVALLGHRFKSDLLHRRPGELSALTQPDGANSVEKCAAMERIARELGSHRFEWAYQRLDGEEVRVEVTLTSLRLGRQSVLLAEWHDVSERARYEDALRQARDAAVKHASAKSNFLATMSHEIRTPMNGVIGMTRLLQDTSLSGQQWGYVETIRACGEGMLALINDILDFSKLDAGKVQFEAIPFSLREVAEDAMAVVAETAQGKGLELVSFIGPMVPSLVRGDPTRVRQVLLNLLSNAVKFTETGAVTVRLTSGREESGRTVVTLSVKDTGIGIAPDALGRLFDAFSQEDASTTRRFGGTGLGLAIVKRLVTLLDGIVDVTSAPTGSTFTVSFALEVLEASRPWHELRSRRILLVEDRPLLADSVCELLRERGGEVQAVRTWDDALLLAPDAELVMVDSRFALGRGVELARALRRSGHLVGLLTPLSAPAELASEADFIVSAPLRRGQLLAQVSRVLALPAGSQPKAATAQRRAYGARVLVAEDNPVNQRVVQGLLAKLGCEAVVVPDGACAVESSRDGRFDIILMDCQMPVMDGFEATRRIRAQQGAHTPIVALTAGVLDGDRQRCLDAGMDEFLAKPVRVEDLERILAWVALAQGASLTPHRGL
jgi:PAS domain S-box-containing protein